MKYFALILLLFGLSAASNGLSLDGVQTALREINSSPENKEINLKDITLKEYLDSLSEPDPFFRPHFTTRECNCEAICGSFLPLNHDGETCPSDRWIPNYHAIVDCDCLIGYKCCPQKCPEADPQVCWKNDRKGFRYGIEEVDCCGCEVIKCLDCAPPPTQEQTCLKSKPAQCYTYTAQATHKKKSGCYTSACTENKNDAPPDQECDTRCMVDTTSMTTCLNPHNTCAGARSIGDCPLKDVADNAPELNLDCYSSPTQVVDAEGGFYHDSGACLPCAKWNYEKLSCETKNAAANALVCLGQNGLDPKCWRKKIDSDACNCNYAVCVKDHSEEEKKFAGDETCPKNNVKIAGVSICGVARDLCKRCPTIVPILPQDCSFGSVVESKDCNGCPTSVCQKATQAGRIADCLSATFVYNEETNELDCLSNADTNNLSKSVS